MITFFGTSPRSAIFLEKAILNGLKVDLVVSEPPKPIGKKQIVTENPVISVAKKLSLSFLSNLSDLSNLENLDLGLILDFNKIIPNEIINLFSKGIINIHFSKLPQYRGAAPVQYTILSGDKEAWITYYLISEKLDGGKIISQTSLALGLTENTETLYQKLIEKSADEVGKILEDYTNGPLIPQVQSGVLSNTRKLIAENCKIDWSKSPVEIERLIRAAYPEPGAWTFVILNISERSSQDSSPAKPVQNDENKKHLKILKAHMENDQLILDQVQLEGKNPVSFKQFKEGYPEAKLV